MSIQIGHIKTRNKVFLAPMSGITDLPFRQMAHAHGAGLVVSEMIASKELARSRADMVLKTRKDDISPFVIQLSGREEHWMAQGAKVAQDLGCDAIDINMGCPARQVTGSLSGSALMRNLDHAISLVEATVEASSVPVTLKMRLGWDDETINAPELARRAENAGVQLITVHGRTRCQFYKGSADWQAIAAVKDEISIPLIANGDGCNIDDVKQMMALSGADGVMIGRGAYGRPWVIGELAEQLESGTGCAPKSLDQQMALYLEHYETMMSFHGTEFGVRIARKHLGWMMGRLLEQKAVSSQQAKQIQTNLMRACQANEVTAHLGELARIISDGQARCAA